MKKFYKYNKKGFTLIELVMTIVIVGIVSIPASLIVAQHIESYLEAQDYAIALNLARSEMEKVNNLDYDQVAVGVTFTANYENYDYDLARVVEYAFGTAGSAESMKKVTVFVAPTGTTDILVTLVTFLTKNVSYGV